MPWWVDPVCDGSQDTRIKGKAAVDVLCSRFGKSGGAFLQQALVMHFGTIIEAAPVVAILFSTVSTLRLENCRHGALQRPTTSEFVVDCSLLQQVCAAWIYSATNLSRLYHDLSKKME